MKVPTAKENTRGPRPYRLGQRQAAIDETRSRIITAARELLTSDKGFSEFTIDGVARQAGVARMTVYYQFGSKLGLLEALSDFIAANAGLSAERVSAIFRQPEPLDALAQYIALFGSFWESDRQVTRRFHGLAALDPDFEQVLHGRQERRRHGLKTIVERLAKQQGQPSSKNVDTVVNALYTLTSFETFDSLAATTQRFEEVTPVVHHLALSALGFGSK